MVGLTGYIVDSDLFKTEKPYRYAGPPTGSVYPDKNFENPQLEMPLTDIRTVPDFKPTLDSHGFCFVENKSKELPTLTDESNSQPYADEMAERVKEISGAETVWAFNTRLRSASKEHQKVPITCDAHTDVAYGDSWARVRGHLTQKERDLALAGKIRVRILNLWRPMVNHAEDFPLAVLDPHSIADINDVVNVDLSSPLGAAELAFFKYDSRHRWYWMSNMTPDEMVLFTQLDTHPPDGKFNLIGHAAFRNTDARPGCPPRQSVEARFVLLEPAPYEKEKPFGELVRAETRKQPWKEFLKLPEETVPPPVPEGSQRKMVFGYKAPASKPAAPPVPAAAPALVEVK